MYTLKLQKRMLSPSISSLVVITFSITTTFACSLGSKSMSVCLHRYLERDFSVVEDLLQRPPYGENGHILIEEGDLEAMCSRLGELKSCYEAVFSNECVSYTGYSQMKRILKIMHLVHGNFCGDQHQQRYQGIKDLIEGGYCIEHVRKGSVCGSENPTLEVANETSISDFDLSTLKSVSPKHRWPYTMIAMLRFEAGVNVCPYLISFTRCMTPNVQLRCREESRAVWRNSSSAILQVWCGNSSFRTFGQNGLILVSVFWTFLFLFC